MAILKETIEGNIINVIIESSNLSSATYDTSSKKLSVTFKSGNIYEYVNVPWEVFTKFRMASSQGSFFAKNIAKSYTYNKV